jgi:diaminopimelate epimerase
MRLLFQKFHGAGNDFIMVDARSYPQLAINQLNIEAMCHRRFGIGADGFIILRPVEGYDYQMDYYNSDGRLGTMCGNGGRCVAAFAYQVGAATEKQIFLAVDGPHEAQILSNQLVKLRMTEVSVLETRGADFFLNTGSPHYVAQVPDAHHHDTINQGRKIRYNDEFAAQGTNVNFYTILSDNQLQVATYERGVEDETLACGTGVVACTLVAAKQLGIAQGQLNVQAKGGYLSVEFQQNPHGGWQNIYLTGPAQYVFSGELQV